MQEEQINEVVEQQPEIDYKSFYEEHRETIEKLPGLLNKQKELLAETKAAKEEKRRLEQLAKQEQQQHAEKNGQFEQLWKQEKEEKEKLYNQLLKDKQERRQEKIDLVATKMAVDLAKGDANKAELLSVFVAKSLGQVADDSGNLDNDVLDSIKTNFEADNRFKPLLGGNLSVGGGAPGNNRSAGSTQTMNRAEFDKMPVYKQAEFIAKVRKGSAQLVD